MKLLGLDVGTSTICGLLLDAGDGSIPFLQTESNTAGIPAREPWESLQDPDAAVRIARQIIDKALSLHPDVRGIGIASQMHGILYTDGKGNAVSPLYTWQDGRGDLPFREGSYASCVSAALGRPAATGMGAVTHFANVKMRLVPKSAACLCTIGDYLAMKLGGRTAPVTDVSNAAGMGGFELEKLAFDVSGLSGLGLDPAFFPEVTGTYPAIGELKGTAAAGSPAKLSAPKRGIPVFPAVGDNQASFLGSIADKDHMALVMVGTGSQISVFVPSYRWIKGLDLRPLPFGGYIGVGAGLCGGRAYAALREFFRRTVLTVTGEDREIPWDVMNDMSMEAAADALRVDTRFSGTRASPEARGSITNLGLGNFTPQHLASGVREGIVAELLGFYKLLDKTERDRVRMLVGSGNAIRLGAPLQRAFQEGFGVPLRVPRHREETAFGAALIAGVASGSIPDLAAAGSLVRYQDAPDSQA